MIWQWPLIQSTQIVFCSLMQASGSPRMLRAATTLQRLVLTAIFCVLYLLLQILRSSTAPMTEAFGDLTIVVNIGTASILALTRISHLALKLIKVLASSTSPQPTM